MNSSNFPLIKIKKKINQHPSSSIIFNAANEMLVEYFLGKKVPFLGISKGIFKILSDSNFKKYAIKKPTTIKDIIEINDWAKEKINKFLHIN